MDYKPVDGSQIKAYLLGELVEEARLEFEKRMMTDNDLYNQVVMAEDELVEEYALGRLSGKEKESFEANFLSTREGREQLSLTSNLIKYASMKESEPAGDQVQPLKRKQSFFTTYAGRLAAAIIILAAGLGVWRVFLYESDVEKGTAALRSAYRGGRPIEARLTGFDYAPRVTLRGDDQGNVDRLDHNRAERILLDEVTDNPSSSSHHALGQLYLADRRYEDAIDQFTEALKLDPQNARAHSDLGAALLERGRLIATSQEGSPDIEAFARSLTHLNRALAIDPDLNEALFNRALLRQQMMFVDGAAEDWRAYLEKDSNSRWADEARSNLEELEKRQRRIEQGQQNLVEDFLNACRAQDSDRAWDLLSSNRQKLTTEITDLYINKSRQRSGPNDSAPLVALAYAGEIDLRRVGDRYTLDLAQFYRSASQRQLVAAAEAHELSRRATKAYMESKLESAIDLYTKSQRILLQIGDVCEARMAAYSLGLFYLEMTRVEQSAALLSSLARDCEAEGYLWLQARALFYISGIESNRNEYSKAIASAKQARAAAEKVNDRPCAFSAGSALIEYYRQLGNRRECLGEISRSLLLLSDSAFGPISMGRHYGIAAQTFNTFGLDDVALDCQRESLRFAVQMDDFASLSVAHALLGLMYGKLQNYTEAFKNVDLAYTQGEAHASEILGREKMAYAELQRGNLYRESGDTSNALASYNRSIELYRSLDFPTHLYQAYKGRLVCYIAQHDERSARQQLEEVLVLIDKHRTNIFEEENRNNFFDIEQSVYDLGIDFEYSLMQNGQKAFEYAEASRARSLLDSMNRMPLQIARSNSMGDLLLPSGARPFSLEEIKARIPADALLLQYAVLEDKLLIWVVSRDKLEKPVEVKLSQAALNDKVSSYITSLKGSSGADREATSRLGRELFGYLIAPVEPMFGAIRTLHVVPDKALNGLPWDALISPTSGRYVIEDYQVMPTPSATLFAICTDLGEQKAGPRAERVMSVGNPTFNRDTFPNLPTLSDADREAQDITAFYTSSRRLLGPMAREQAVRDELARVDVAHFALHCVIDERSPMRSSLVLAKEPSAGAVREGLDGVLQAREIYDLKLARLRVAVLSACQTGVERYYRGEGMIGMARAFLIARTPLVVASLWPVDSRATAKLMVRFHQQRKTEGSTAKALWLAKRSLLKGDTELYREPFYWAAFQAIGGHANF